MRFGVTEDDLRAGQRDAGRPRAAAVRVQQGARATTSAPPPTCPPADARSLVAAEIMGGIYFEILQRIERAGYDVFTPPHPRAAPVSCRDRPSHLARTLLRRPRLAWDRPLSPTLAGATFRRPGAADRPLTNVMKPHSNLDVIVIGAGFAGSAPPRRWPSAARGCWCSRRGRRSAGAPRRSPIPPRASAWTTASTCSLAAITRRSGSSGASAPSRTCSVQPQLAVDIDRSAVRGRRASRARRCRHRCTLPAGVMPGMHLDGAIASPCCGCGASSDRRGRRPSAPHVSACG